VNSSVDRVGRGAWPVGLSHGDFAPVNGLIDDGRVAAVIDLAEVARRHRLVDPAWWLLVVRHHHPDAARVLSERFLATAFAGVTRPAPDELAGVAVARAAQRLSMARLDGRAHAGALLRAALEWAAEARSRGRADRHSLSPPETV
jgi:Ser/Thr protein kinase RdoA (MazF antagonist)